MLILKPIKMKNKLYFVAIFACSCQIGALAVMFTADNGETILDSIIVFLVCGFIAGGALILEKILSIQKEKNSL